MTRNKDSPSKRIANLEMAIEDLLACIVAEPREGDIPTYRCEGGIHEAVEQAKEVMGYGEDDT